ncbi:hypothetical protein HMPREF1982_03760 [Clostridiales bacterium oral taxon 876 str. F0540]|nr:hypothetical protein HMPREF1982_03760 [Clostridiales bacterium oral taxon 876 str. F0540]
MISRSIKGITMNTKELKNLVLFFKDQGISPTVKELCTMNIYISAYRSKIAS